MKFPFLIFQFYVNGFKSMTAVGRTLWLLVTIKLLVLFAFLKPFFFQDHLTHNSLTSAEKPAHVARELLSRSPAPSSEGAVAGN